MLSVVSSTALYNVHCCTLDPQQTNGNSIPKCDRTHATILFIIFQFSFVRSFLAFRCVSAYATVCLWIQSAVTCDFLFCWIA